LRRSTAAEWANACPFGIVLNNPALSDETALRASLTRLQEQAVSLIWVQSDSHDPNATAMLLRSAKAKSIKVALAPSWASLPADDTAPKNWTTTTLPAVQHFLTALKPKPDALALGTVLASDNAIRLFQEYQLTNTAATITTLACIRPDATETFIAHSPESAVLTCALQLKPNASGTPNDYAAFIRDGNRVVEAAQKATMTPLALLAYNSTRDRPAPQLTWQAWTAMAMGFKGVVLALPDPPFGTMPITPAFTEMAHLRPILARLVPCEDFLGLTPISGKSYPGDFTRFFYDPKSRQYVVAVVLSPERPGTEPLTLRGGSVTPMATTPALNQLHPAHGGLYQIPLSRERVSALDEARRLSPIARHLRDELFVPTFGNHFSVLADYTLTPRLLYCAEPVALLIHPNIVLTPVAGATPLVEQNSTKAPAYRSAHVSGFTLYRIGTANRFQRMIILEEDGSVPGYDLRAASIANIGVTNNGVCPRPARNNSHPLPPDQCLLQYDLAALRAVAGLNPSYPLFFQFDGGNTDGQSDTRFHVWAGVEAGKLTERLSPRQPVSLVFLNGEDKVLKIGMPYNPTAATQPVLRRWSFFTWLRPATPSKTR
jgi:hypothetical protein